MGTEPEVSRLLAAHVRWLKPRLVIETGTFHADTTSVMYEALVENASEGFPGELRSYETDPDAHVTAVERMTRIGDHPDAVLRLSPTTLQQGSLVGCAVDLAFVDSAYESRVEDVATIMQRLSRHGLCFVHDAMKKPMRDAVAEWKSKYRLVHYPTARGLALLQRRRP